MKEAIFSLLDQSANNFSVVSLLGELHLKDPEFLLYEPELSDIKGPQDRWVCHSAEAMGLSVEVLDGRVISVSVVPHFDTPLDFFSIEVQIQTLISMKSRLEVQGYLGLPMYSTELFDHYLLNDEVVLGVLSWPHMNDEISTFCFGSKRIFSSPERIPNRSSFTFDSLYHQFNFSL